MWPIHCVQGSKGAEFHEKCPNRGEKVISKGEDKDVEAYSGLEGPPGKEFDAELKKQGITDVYCVGLAYDYCVGSTAVDAAKLGYKTFIVMDGTRAVNSATAEAMKKRLDAAGVTEISLDQVPKA